MNYIPFIAALGCAALVLFFVFRFSHLDPDNVLKVVGVVATVVSLVVGVVEYTSTQRDQTAASAEASYIAATQKLTEPGVARPLSGITAMAQLAEHDSERTWLMTESLDLPEGKTTMTPTLEALGDGNADHP
jgi:hypothetical protein